MELIPMAKPVKIRIKSGGEEHSSLESLKRNFNISDINPLLDGRLARWLRQQGESALADATSIFESDRLNTLQGKLDFLEIFFENIYTTGDSVKDMLELVKYWLKEPLFDKNGKNLLYDIVYEYDSGDEQVVKIVKNLYSCRTEIRFNEIDWVTVFSHLITKNDEGEIEGDAEILYLLGKLLWNNSQDLKGNIIWSSETMKGLEYIEKSALFGYSKADYFMFDYIKYLERYGNDGEFLKVDRTTPSANRFEGIDLNKVKKYIDHGFTPDMITSDEMINSDETNAKENEIAKEIMLFILDCRLLTSYSKLPTTSWDMMLQKAEMYFCSDERPYSITTRKERWFIIGLLYRRNSCLRKAKLAFTEASDYPPAQYILSDRQQIKGCNLKSMTLPDQITFVVKHLFDYE